MFESWLEQEKAGMKTGYRTVRIVSAVVALLAGPYMLFSLLVILRESVVGICAGVAVSLLFTGFVLSLGDYKRRFLKPLMAAIQQELPSGEAREEFARQMLTEAVHISCRPKPGIKYAYGGITAGKSYCYVRQPRVCIFRTIDICRAELIQEDSAPGSIGRLHVSLSYALALYTAENAQEPVWKGYFPDEGELYQVFARFRPLLPREAVIQDEIAAGEIRTW